LVQEQNADSFSVADVEIELLKASLFEKIFYFDFGQISVMKVRNEDILTSG
jgi:hypothetical protein